MSISTDLHNWDGANPYHEAFAHEADIVFLSTTALTDTEGTMRRTAERGRAWPRSSRRPGPRARTCWSTGS